MMGIATDHSSEVYISKPNNDGILSKKNSPHLYKPPPPQKCIPLSPRIAARATMKTEKEK